MAHVSTEEIEKLGFGKECVQLEIPKKTDCLIITTISKAINGSINVSTKSFSADEIEKFKLDPTLMKRIAKFNKTRELQQIEEQIKEKQEQIKELDELLQDKQKRWKKVKNYITNIYELDLDEDNEDDYYYDD